MATSHPKYIIFSLLGAFIPFFAVIWMTIAQTGGYFEYPLDDPYIHLAMSEQIANGGYGVNGGEYASASSSILFPFLLAPFAGSSFHAMVPLFWGALGLLGSAYLWGRFVGETAARSAPIAGTYLLVLALIGPLFLHLVGVSLAGMEHGLQVLAAMMVALGLIRYAQTGGVGWMLIAGVILSPLLRFEGLGVACFACAVLLLSGRPKTAVGLGLAALLPVLAYFAAMNAIGLAPLPNSVMAKSAVVGGDMHAVHGEKTSQFEALSEMVKDSVSSTSGVSLMVLAIFWLAGAWLGRHIFGRIGALLALSVSAVVLTHLFLGSIGVFFRYEIYAWTYGAVISLYLLSQIWARYDLAARIVPVAFVLALFIGGKHYPLQTFFIYPDGGAAIGVQQREMGRFVDDYVKGPVAVNDLGHVAYRNPHYVLDLWGLASREALDMRLLDPDPNWADGLIARYDVGVVMIYDWWFEGRKNPDWIKVAELKITRPIGALGGRIVAFYAVNKSHEAKLRADLGAFAPTLPDGTQLDIMN